MNGYADKDVEDVYDAGDPVPVRLAVLERIVAAIPADPTRRDIRRLDAIRVAGALAREHDVDRIRLAVILDELEAM